MLSTSLLWNSLSPGRHRIGKSEGNVDMGESAPCSKIGLAHVRNGGVLPMNLGRRYRPCPCLGHPMCGARMGKATCPAHSPNIAQAWVHSRGVFALHPRSGVSINPPCNASEGSSGTADEASKRARLLRSSASHSEGDLLMAVVAIRRALWALESLSSVFPVEVSWSAVCSSCGSMLTSGGHTGTCPVTMTRPALTSALDSVISSTAGRTIMGTGHCVALFKRIWPPERHPASRSATNSSLSVSKLHCQDCQRGRPTTGGPYMLISLVIDWSHCPCISLPHKKREKANMGDP